MSEQVNIGNLIVKGLKKGKPKLKSEDGELVLPFYQTKKTLGDLQEFNKFIKDIEKKVRTSIDYTQYKHNLIEIGLNRCQVLSNITVEDAEIEMHHGPILTLYDYAAIITRHMLENKQPITSYRVTDILLQEHYNNNVQITMLSTTVHELVTAGLQFLNMRHGFGSLTTFLQKYRDGIDEKMLMVMRKNIELSEQEHSNDNGYLALRELVKDFS